MLRYFLLILSISLYGCGGGGDSSSSNTTDTTPSAFSFVDQTNIALSTPTESSSISVAGTEAASTISVSNGEYSIDGNSYASVTSSISSGQTVTVRHTSSATNFATVDTTLTIGGVSDTFTTTTVGDCVPVTPTYNYTIVDTNQTLCYNPSTGASVTCSGLGQDADYSGNQPNYTSCNNGTVVNDNHTGLMWQSSSDVDGVSGLDVNDKMTRANADTYCANLDYGAYTDWRLPSTKELFSIYLFSGQDISGLAGATTNGTAVNVSGVPPFIDTTYFDVAYGDTDTGERKIDGQYAASTLNISQVMSGITNVYEDGFFGVNFADGHVKSYEATHTGMSDPDFYARCVRDNTSYGTNSFVDNSADGTISDTATNLMWETADSTATSFGNAVGTCEAATTATHTDWRLPNIKELQSIVDYSKSPSGTSSAAIDTAFFTATSFTNEADPGQTDWGYYWSSSALLDKDGLGDKGAYITFGRGLGYISAVVDVHGAGAQRADYKTTTGRDSDGVTPFTVPGTATFGTTAYRKGPQGDIIRVENNYVRCVRDIP